MAFKLLLLSLTLLSVHPFALAQDEMQREPKKNLCDDMIKSGKATQEQIAKCHSKFGKSEKYLADEQKKKWLEEAEALKREASEAKAARLGNIEIQSFTAAELDEAGFGKSFYAIRVDYSNPRWPKEKRITEGNALCKYLGYEKALKSTVSPEIKPLDAYKNGLVIDTNFLGYVSKEPELYDDSGVTYTVRKYVGLTCAKVKSKEIEGTKEELGKVAEDLVVLNEVLNSPKKEEAESGVNDGSRKPTAEKVEKTPNAYKVPEWKKEAPATDDDGGVSR